MFNIIIFLFFLMFNDMSQTNEKLEHAAFGAGCFWGVESIFQNTKGVISTKVGYMGGNIESPTYKLVCTGTTGHAETVKITFNSTVISYEELLKIFWDIHDPTTENRQGPDIGPQYRSVVFYYTEKQKETALKIKNKIENSDVYSAPIVTEIVKAPHFYPAEDYHQDYFKKRGIKYKSCYN